MQLWETTDQPAGRELGGQLSGPRTIALSGDGRYLATISAADRAVQVWDPRTLEQGPAVAGGQFGAGQVAFARNGPALASGGGWAPLRVWPSIEQAPRDFEVRLPDPVDVVAIAPDGSVAAAAGGGAVVWFDVASGQRRSVNTDGSPVRGIDFNPDGSVIGDRCRRPDRSRGRYRHRSDGVVDQAVRFGAAGRVQRGWKHVGGHRQ